MKEINYKKDSEFIKVKSYSIEEILELGGVENFTKLKGFDKVDLSNLEGENISEKDYEEAMSILKK